jgi:DNA phosphorothioation-dependent restriction protein DptG
MDLTKIKELVASHERTHTGPNALRRMADAVPDLLAEIERLTALAREGWQEAKELANSEGYRAIENNADRKLAEIGDAS